jgi:hypothetical protein
MLEGVNVSLLYNRLWAGSSNSNYLYVDELLNKSRKPNRNKSKKK